MENGDDLTTAIGLKPKYDSGKKKIFKKLAE